MKIEKLRLKGFTGIKKGLGLDEIEIDFTNISGLVAFEGDNGSGKTTVLENLHPHNTLASRDGALFHHVYTRNAEKELIFSYGGHNYRTLIKIDCQSEKQEGFIWKDGNSEVNGKISEYAKYMKDLLGSPELFFNSVFCAQNSKKLSDLRTGELKELFAEFLRLDRLQEYENTSKQAANVYNGQLGQIDTRIAGLKERLEGIEQIKEGIALHQKRLLDLQADQDCMKGELSSYRTEAEKLKDIISQNTVLIQRKNDIASTIERLQKELGKEKTDAESEIEALKTKYRGLAVEIEKCNTLLKDKDSIMGAVEREHEISTGIDLLTLELDQMTDEISERQKNITGLEAGISTLKQSAAILNQSITDTNNDRQEIELNNKIAQCEDKKTALNLKDPECISSTCSFIVGALEAEKELPELEKQLAERVSLLETERQKHVKGIVALTVEQDTLSTAINKEKDILKHKTETATKTRQDLTKLRALLTEVKELAGKQSEVQVAEFRLSDLTKMQTDITEQGIKLRAAWTEKEADKIADIEEHMSSLTAIESKIDSSAVESLESYKKQIQEIEIRTLPSIEKDITETKEKIAGLQSELSRMAEAEKEIETTQTERDRITSEISEWTYLKNACGKNGLQALEIDGAAPLITGYANDLLTQAFGPLFTVKFRTQDDEGKECLDIVVIGEEGEDVLLENLSGGERVWILMALRLAMTLLSKEKSGRFFRVAFADELDGSLDMENAQNFVNMYRSFMQVGEFDSFFFISHRPECRNMADHILTFEYGKNPSWR